MTTSTKQTIDKLIKSLMEDKDYRASWQANIAMAFVDNANWHLQKKRRKVVTAQDVHIIANNAAHYFLKQLCGEIKIPEGR